MKLAKMFIENGAAGIHIEDLRLFKSSMGKNRKVRKMPESEELTES
jgi:isocitrate lyase